jgi:hypothetical protein
MTNYPDDMRHTHLDGSPLPTDEGIETVGMNLDHVPYTTIQFALVSYKSLINADGTYDFDPLTIKILALRDDNEDLLPNCDHLKALATKKVEQVLRGYYDDGEAELPYGDADTDKVDWTDFIPYDLSKAAEQALKAVEEIQ